MDTGLLRPLLILVLIFLGAVLRLGNLPRRLRYGLGLPWTFADEDIWRRANRRLGEALLLWALWLGVQLATGMPMAWLPTVFAPLVIVVTVGLTYPARLYVRRYHTLRVERRRDRASRPIPSRRGWAVLLLREILPLAAVLGPILLVRNLQPELPDRIPVRWGFDGGPAELRWREEALDLLRHQTMLVYLLLALLEGGYLLIRWARGSRGDVALRMLTPSHWLYFLFRLGWVALFAGFNAGFVTHAAQGGALLPWLLPGIGILSLMGVLAGVEFRRTSYFPPADS